MPSIKINSLETLESACLAFMTDQPIHDSAHDINHIKRVVNNAKLIASGESADLWIVIAAAWLHDCITFPKNDPNNKKASQFAAHAAVEFLSTRGFPEEKLNGVFHAVEAHSYSANIATQTLEAEIVQDADRLDGLGAIGIARCFTVSGKLGSALYNNDDPFCNNRNPDSKLAAVDHFYEKLFKTAEQMKTATGKMVANERVNYMKQFLEQLGTEIG